MHKRTLRERLIGSPLETHRLSSEKLDTPRALAALSPDALSSIAYANQEIFLGLITAGAAGLAYAFPISLAIVGLLIILAFSYAQTIHAYPQGGGSYTVASENLGALPGLITGAALLLDYVLTAAVSLTAGVAALTSAFPELETNRVILSLVMLLLITLLNLRGIRETGTLMAIPVYLFIGMYALVIGAGLLRGMTQSPGGYEVTLAARPALTSVTLGLVLHAFASGCTALTGVEAISNAVSVFKPPESTRAVRALRTLALLMTLLFLGTIGVTQLIAPMPAGDETILSALTHKLFGSGGMYYGVQISTLLILLVAANTSFTGFPRVASILAHDGYLPRQLTILGDRLVFSNGMLLLSSLAAVLIILFHGDTHALIPLFAVGVFLAFTLSQAGMVVHWIKDGGPGWRMKSAINGLGAAATGLAFVVIAVSKFLDGAWIIAVLMLLLLGGFRVIHRHYEGIASELTIHGLHHNIKPSPALRLVLPIPGVHRGVIYALRYARTLTANVTAVYVEIDPSQTEKVKRRWAQWSEGVPLAIVPSPYRSLITPFLAHLDELDKDADDGQLATVLLPEFIPGKWWENLLHNQTAWLIKLALLYRRRRFRKVRPIIDFPFHLRH
ncbi:MAG: APC family permease [Anaerolineales bacterium]|nr:APC family permease [Anaerolineales bacterium]